MTEIVILTGAGISAESGIDTFRTKGGLWEQYDVEDVATPEGYARNPQLVLDFYNMRRRAVADARPNEAHKALAELERHKDVLIVTQNVDDLHEKAGSRSVIHMHGAHKNALCNACDARWHAPAVMTLDDQCPKCGECQVRPDVVWFGEIPYETDRISDALFAAKHFVSIGTSGNVYPAAGFVQAASQTGAHCLELNLEQSAVSSTFHETRHGPATEIVPQWVQEMLDGS